MMSYFGTKMIQFGTCQIFFPSPITAEVTTGFKVLVVHYC